MNYLLIFTDQMHKYAIGRLNPQVHTPHLDSLSKDGVLFDQAYSNAPICGPYRGCLMTGTYIRHNGVIKNNYPLPNHMPSMAELMNTAGYNTSFIGKWHLGGNGQGPIPRELQGAFDHFMAYQCYNGFQEDIQFFDYENKMHTYEGHRTDITTDLALENLGTLIEKGEPFLQVVAYQAPHYPCQPSQYYEDIYKDVVFDLSPEHEDMDPYTPTYSPRSPRPFQKCKDYQAYGGDMQAYLRKYYAMVSQVDANVGRLIQKLKDTNSYDNTTIIFTSDHGDLQGSHGHLNKRLPFEKSCGVPFIAYVPNGRRNEVSHELVSAVDILPTYLDMAGVVAPHHLDGHSLYSYLSGKLDDHPYAVYAEMIEKDDWQMIRTKDYKLVLRESTKEPLYLFHMPLDPYEQNNLVKNANYKKQIESMTKDLLIMSRERV